MHDVIIVGAGPAGATLGRELARCGMNVVILEKAYLPRYKPCAGGLPVRTLYLLDVDIIPVVERAVYSVVLSQGCAEQITLRSPQPLLYTVMRDRFDAFLVEQAKAAGAQVVEGLAVERVAVDGERVWVTAGGEDWPARIVVGADGAFSVVTRSLGLMQGVPFSMAIEGEFNVSRSTLAAWEEAVALDLGTLPGSYGWLFPKQRYLSIGVGGFHRRGRELKAYYQAFLAARLGHAPHHLRYRSGHILPHRQPGMAIQRGPVLLLGDAAGLVDPWSGEGIYYAIRSARLAAPVIQAALEQNEVDLRPYEQAVDEELMPDLLTARVCGWIYRWCPGLFMRLARREGPAWRALCMLMQKGTTYARLRARIRPLDLLVRWMNKTNRR